MLRAKREKLCEQMMRDLNDPRLYKNCRDSLYRTDYHRYAYISPHEIAATYYDAEAKERKYVLYNKQLGRLIEITHPNLMAYINKKKTFGLEMNRVEWKKEFGAALTDCVYDSNKSINEIYTELSSKGYAYAAGDSCPTIYSLLKILEYCYCDLDDLLTVLRINHGGDAIGNLPLVKVNYGKRDFGVKFGERLKELKDKHGLSASRLAYMTLIGSDTIRSHIYKGIVPSSYFVYRYINALNLTEDEILYLLCIKDEA